jgi:hypothetical protein
MEPACLRFIVRACYYMHALCMPLAMQEPSMHAFCYSLHAPACPPCPTSDVQPFHAFWACTHAPACLLHGPACLDPPWPGDLGGTGPNHRRKSVGRLDRGAETRWEKGHLRGAPTPRSVAERFLWDGPAQGFQADPTVSEAGSAFQGDEVSESSDHRQRGEAGTSRKRGDGRFPLSPMEGEVLHNPYT